MSIEANIAKPIPPNKHILVVCDIGINRSPLLYDILKANGYKNVDFGGVSSGLKGREATWEMINRANYIIAVDQQVKDDLELRMFEFRYSLRYDQVIITLNIREVSNYHSLKEIGTVLQEQIQPYIHIPYYLTLSNRT